MGNCGSCMRRAPGAYTLTADMQGFRRFEQRNLTLSAGQTVVANIQLEVGGIELVPVDVSSTVSPAPAGRIDLGRTIGESEIRNLPLVSRNPYNFAFLQANVTGYENNEFGVPRITANGSQMHTNYQLDGNTNTETDFQLPTPKGSVRDRGVKGETIQLGASTSSQSLRRSLLGSWKLGVGN